MFNDKIVKDFISPYITKKVKINDEKKEKNDEKIKVIFFWYLSTKRDKIKF